MTLSIELYRSVPRYVAAKTVATKLPGLLAGPVAPLRLVHRDERSSLPVGWARLRPRLAGICGSDLNTISGGSSFYFSPLVSMPFVPGHEVVADLVEDCEDLKAGQRVVIDPVLHCATRGIDPVCGPCASGDTGLCERVTGGHISPGLQTGYCADTGGGWSEGFRAHRRQLFAVPEELPDEAAVMVEPMACAIHAVKRAAVADDARVLIVGAGTVGLLTLIALRSLGHPGAVTVIAKHAQQADLARRYGATDTIAPSAAITAIRRSTRAFSLVPERGQAFLLGGVDCSFDCVGSKSSLTLALRATSARGRVVMSGMPAGVDLSPAWFRELELVGAYSGAGCFPDAIELAGESDLGKLVSATYPLQSWRSAIDHALDAGSLGATKIAFDPRLDL